MRTNVIKVLVLFQMSVRELKLGVARKEFPNSVLRDASQLMAVLITKNHA